MEVTIRSALPSDQPEIQVHLKEAGLPFEDIVAHLNHFFVAESFGRFIGCVGLEIYTNSALLRSLVVAVDNRQKGVGERLCGKVFEYAERMKVEKIYLLTETAADFFGKLGFEQIERNLAPVAIQATTEFTSLCPSTARCMALSLST